MARREDGTEPAWTALLSIPTLVALLGAALFFMTILQPSQTPIGNKAATAASGDLNLSTVLDDVNNMEPMDLLRKAENNGGDDSYNLAVGMARHQLEMDKLNVKKLMCAGNVFVAVPNAPDLNKEGYDDLREACELCPSSKYVRLNLARALVRGKRYEEAIVEYENIVKTSPDVLPSLELARLYLANNDEDKAIKVLNTVLEKDSGNIPARKLLGAAEARNKNEKEGFEDYIKAFAQEQMIGYPDSARDLVEKNNGSLNKAVAEQRTIETATPNFDTQLKLAEMLLFQSPQDFPDSLSEANKILDGLKAKNGNNPELHRLYAELYHQMNGKGDKSFQEWQQANKLDKEQSS